VGGVDVPMPYSKHLEKAAIPNAGGVVARVMEIL
jgi:pyruvate dehydrogenase E1 component beta subunit